MEGNERANKLARIATAEQIPAPPGLAGTKQSLVASHALGIVKELNREQWRNLYASAKGGKHTRDLDKTLPGEHTRFLYDHLSQPTAAILAQMRTGKCKLKSYLHLIGAEDSDLCECGQKETVKHVLLDCRRWNAERRELRMSMRDISRWGDVSFLLGGWSGRKDPAEKYVDGEAASWKPNLGAVKATIDFAKKIGRFDTEGQTG